MNAPLDSAHAGVVEGKIDIAVLVSGSGTNLQALLDTSDILPRIKLVASDRAGVSALARASLGGVDTEIVPWRDYPDRAAFSSALADLIEDRGCKGVVLAGFMRILSPSFVDRFPGRILNIHPSLLPSFPGAHAVQNAIDRKVKITGVTVHLVDEKVDHGPIVAQRAVPVEPGDTAETLHARIQIEEHSLYPAVVRALVNGELSPDGKMAKPL